MENERKINLGVHASHCCVWHGCKYGNEDCPVVLLQVEQEYPCESCDDSEPYEDFNPTPILHGRQEVIDEVVKLKEDCKVIKNTIKEVQSNLVKKKLADLIATLTDDREYLENLIIIYNEKRKERKS